MTAKRGYCPHCEKRLPRNNHAAWKRRDHRGWKESRDAGDMWCEACDAACDAAESESLREAESGVGLEKLREVEFERDFGGR
jgi:hypothetical protein